MRHLPTPIADELLAMSAVFSNRAGTDRPLGTTELQLAANRMLDLASRTAKVERFHAELTAEAAEEELRQTPVHVPTSPIPDIIPPSDALHLI